MGRLKGPIAMKVRGIPLPLSQSCRDVNPGIVDKMFGTGRSRTRVGLRCGMNKTEAEFGMILEEMKRKGEILRYEFEGITLRWFDMRYTPDFVVIVTNPTLDRLHTLAHEHARHSHIKFIEIKGAYIHYSQQAMARFKGARGFWPEFTFELWQRSKEGWKQLI